MDSIQTVLAHSRLLPLMQKAQTLNALLPVVKHYLPESLAQSVRITLYEEGKLWLQVHNSSAASRLRYLKESLLTALQSETCFHNLVTIEIKLRSG